KPQPAPNSPQISWDAPKKPDNFAQRIGLVPNQEQINNAASEPPDISEVPGAAFKGLGKIYSEAGPEQFVAGARNIVGGNVARGSPQVIAGGRTPLLPLVREAVAAKPVMALRALAGGYAGSKIAEGGASLLGADPEQQQLWGDVGNLAGGFTAASGLPRALL